ncbi:MAG TPA: hypothetical protein VND64_08055, partial [Pirellulales bacterium]|nr:hypothetical protein [Pirellulales bacterium]
MTHGPSGESNGPPLDQGSPLHEGSPAQKGAHDPYAVLRLRSFRLYMSGNFLAICGMQMQTV